MKFKRIILFTLLFLLVGELLVRFNYKIKLLEKTKTVMIKTEIANTDEYESVINNNFDISDNILRILILGDSYIHGGGINFEDKISQQLKKMFSNTSNQNKEVLILDISKPNANNLDNYQLYNQFKDKFDPQIVILGYNYNDVSGSLEKGHNQVTISRESKTAGGTSKSIISKVYQIAFKSKAFQILLHKFHNQLKASGMVFPNSVFDLTLKAYYENKENWSVSKSLLSDIYNDINNRKSKLIVYKFPEMNMLEHPNLFVKPDESIGKFFLSFDNLVYIDGTKEFSGLRTSDYRLSKIDGHPNELAHKRIANKLYEILQCL